MPTEDVVIRIRVDDSELRRELGDLRRRGTGVPAQGLVSPATAGAVTAGLAGAATTPGGDVSAKGRGVVRDSIMDAQQRTIDQLKKTPEGRKIIEDIGEEVLEARKDISALERNWRTSVEGEKAFDVGGRRGRMTIPFRADSSVWIPNYDLQQKRIDLDESLKAMGEQGQLKRPAPRSIRDVNNIRMVNQMWGGGSVLDSVYAEGVFTAPLTRAERNLTAPLSRRSLLDRTLHGVGHGIKAPYVVGKESFQAARRGAQALGRTRIGGAIGSGLGKAKELFDQVGGIASIGGLIAAAKASSEQRSMYVKKLLAGEDIPSGGIIQAQLSGVKDKSVTLLGEGLFTTMFEIPAFLSSVINFISPTDFFGTDDEWEVAVDMVGQQFREDLGLTEDYYRQVRVQQRNWSATVARVQEAAKRQARSQADSLAAVLQGLGVDGVSLNELSNTVFKETNFKMQAKARRDFEKDNPFPTHGQTDPQEGIGLADVITFGSPVGAGLRLLSD